MSTYTATAYDNCGQPVGSSVTGYMLERVVDPSKATTVSSATAIQAGTYSVVKRADGKWELQNVPERSGILIHAGNTYDDSTGCLMTGKTSAQSGSNYTVGSSQAALSDLENLMETDGSDGVTISITNE